MTDNYNTPSWILKIFEGWYDPCPISTGEWLCIKTTPLFVQEGFLLHLKNQLLFLM